MSEIAYTPLNQSNSYIQGQSIRKSFYDLIMMYGQLVTPVQSCYDIETKEIYVVPAGKIAFLLGFNHFIYLTPAVSGNGRGYIRLNDTIIFSRFHYYDNTIRGVDDCITTNQNFTIPLKLKAGDKLKLEGTDFTSQVNTVTLFLYELDTTTFEELYKN